MPGISTDKVCTIVVLARRFDVKEQDSDPDSGSNATDDGMVDVLEDGPGDANRQELAQFIRALNVDEQAYLVALAWVGRGTYQASEWNAAVKLARQEHATRTAEYLLGLPLLPDYLEEGLAAFGENCNPSIWAGCERSGPEVLRESGPGVVVILLKAGAFHAHSVGRITQRVSNMKAI